MSIQSGTPPRLIARGAASLAVLILLAVASACADGLSVTDPGPAATASITGTTPIPTGPALWTGKADYVPDEIVDMFGSGWQPGETVVLTLVEQPVVHATRTYQVVADTLGAFLFEGFKPEAHHAGVTFLLSARGNSSGFQAQTTFTDGIATSSVSTNSNSSGTTASQRLTINVGAIVAGQVAIAQIVVNKDLGSNQICPPSGWVSILRTSRSSGVYVQETFRRTTAAVAGSHEWTFRTSCPAGSLIGGKGASGGVIVYDGIDTSNPIRDAQHTDGSSSGPYRAPSAAAVAGDLVLRFFGVEKNTTVVSNPAGTDTTYVEESSSPVERTAAAFDVLHSSGATTGTFDVNFGASAEWTAQTVVLRMAPVANHTLTVALAGTGSGTVTSTPSGINCGADCTESYANGTTVTLTAVAAAGSTFAGWSGAGTTDGTGKRAVSMTEARNVTATFTLNSYALTVTLAGSGSGTVTSSPAGINCGADCSESYDHGTSVTLTAVASPGSTFAGWSGDGATDGAGKRVVSMDQARNVTATFTLNTYALHVLLAGTGSGTVNSSPTGINCGADCSESYGHGTSVTLTAVASPGSTFAGWSGDGTTDISGKRVVDMTQARNVTATFTLNSYALTVTLAGTGSGTVTSSPTGISCGADCSESYDHGTSVTLTAVAAAGSTFAGWSGDGATDGAGKRVVEMDEARNVTATFTLNSYALAVTLAGTGSGTVTSSPAGINCGADCSESYDHGTSVTLTAVAAAGFTFAGWSGAGTTDGDGKRVVEMTQARNVTATFNIGDNQGPVTTNVLANPNPVPMGTSFTISATVDDTQTGNSNIKSAQYSLNDGATWSSAVPNASPGFNTSSVVNVQWTVPAQPVGVYSVCVRGTDVHDNVGPESCILLAIYDPSAGFVTGGGWINTPAGSYRADPSLAGKATFGFVSRYQKGAKVPSGHTEFQFHAADMNFRGTLLEWLVISGPRAQYKGDGTINGTGSYGFLLTANDGQVAGGGGYDRFRIKIWEKATGAIVYDNELGTDDTAPATTMLGGGSIVIHAK